MVSVKVAFCRRRCAVCFSGRGASGGSAAIASVYAPPIEEYVASGWYLRGDIGMSNQKVKSLDNMLFDTAMSRTIQKDFDSAPIFGIGFGYQFNHWFRADSPANIAARPTSTASISSAAAPRRQTNIAAVEVRMAGARQRLRRSRHLGCFTPFIGAGIGGRRT